MIKKISLALFVIMLFGVFAYSANANHSWGSYHWARTANPLALKLGDNMSSAWDAYLAVASGDWTVSSVLDTTVVAGLANPKNCKPTAGRVEVCNGKYGRNGWLGIAQIWASGSHITQGVTKMNDTYFNTAKYNTPAWKQFVVCQEVGHIFGLDHQDENFSNANLGTCMDYTNNPGTNQHPNAHDYEQLETIYAHLDATNTSSSKIANANARVDLDNPSEWGQSIRESSDKKTSVFERDLGGGNKVFTFVIWAE
ncbi:MAG: hypothetical protein UW07_C0022G0003 [Candidatus Nomurabacteria bacterium GW2011_GWF2_43_8]|uniref:Peptidase M10 metallopeptidase domain-containing protein n=3 Tax=Candidatus Nomuraibacteriota TaxID=1752729 RepID=A0A0G1HVQ8_9BACT|nr:MAG: hypothetical protein UV76_C0008G0022 [Candidatus Nomurabacteria bacterium GW2011_GWA2_43_15]KKT19785.1 MAG: hypothetical protein UW02_C0005G0020 [Candidatus Nomurabacteria bacterium GW2011_GWB1_43_7]KKT23712.1 MAG: hypothetical protein UW07_C0022G0003 [Candidatus Nomurabacteria bacterium GW2011_GWF2_43_8]